MNKAILVSMIAVMTLLTLSFVSATTGMTADWQVKVDGAYATDGKVSGIEAGQTIPIEVVFKALECTDPDETVTVEADIKYDGKHYSDETSEFELVAGNYYTRRLSINLPEDVDPIESLTLKITIGDDEESYEITLQRESYKITVLDADMPSQAEAGSVIAVDVVLKNWGMKDLEDVFAKVSISELGVQKKVYFGDIEPLDECEYRDDVCAEDENCNSYRNYFKDCGGEDSASGRLYITIPESAKSGVYDVEIQAYNGDSTETLKKSIAISGRKESTDVLTGSASKTVSTGQEATYDIVIINSGSSMKVYTITAEQDSGLIVDVDPIVTVPADSSRNVRVTVKATDSAEEGTHLVKVNVESDGELIQQASLSANVEKGASTKVTNSVVVLTIVLVIIFVVLLIILIVLLTKKPSTMETEETSYY